MAEIPEMRQRRALAAVSAAAAILIALAVVMHQSAPHRDSLLQTQGGFERRMQALRELKAQDTQSVLFGAEKQAYMNGFIAGEQNAEKDVAEDDALAMSGQRPQTGDELASLMSGSGEKSEEDEIANAIAMRAARMNKIAGLDEAPQKKKQSALARLAVKAAQPAPALLAQPGSSQALKLMDFCARSFKGDEMLQRFCYDRLISEPTGLKQEPVERPVAAEEAIPKFAIVQPPGDPRPELYRVVPVPSDEVPSHEDLTSTAGAPQALLKAAERVHKARKIQPDSSAVEVKANTLQQSINDARKLGLQGSPKAIVYHEEGQNALYVLDKTAKTTGLAQMEQQMQGAPTQMMSQLGEPKLEVDAHSLQNSINRAHEMGMTGVPTDIVYHPAHGSAEIYKLASSKAYPNPDGPIRTRHFE